MEDLSFSENLRPYQPPAQTIAPKKSRKRFYLLISFIAIALGVFLLYKSGMIGGKQETQKSALTPTPTTFQFPTDTPTPVPITPSETNTPTPKPTTSPIDKATGLDRSALTVEVQNGSGVVGGASKASEVLKSFGYHVVSVGNADNFNYENTTIKVKSDKSNYLSLLKTDLQSTYTIGATSSDLSASSSADALVIVGK